MESINVATSDVVASAEMAALAGRDLQALMARIDSATSNNELDTLMAAATGANPRGYARYVEGPETSRVAVS